LTMAACAPTIPESPTPFAPSGWLRRSHFSGHECCLAIVSFPAGFAESLRRVVGRFCAKAGRESGRKNVASWAGRIYAPIAHVPLSLPLTLLHICLTHMGATPAPKMTVLNVGHFAGSGAGHAPKRPTVFEAGESRNSTPSAKARGKGAFLVNRMEGRTFVAGLARVIGCIFELCRIPYAFWELGACGQAEAKKLSELGGTAPSTSVTCPAQLRCWSVTISIPHMRCNYRAENDGVERRAFRRLWSWAMSLNAPQIRRAGAPRNATQVL
jgi:hypothetical protein